ncbi:MAG: protein disulfide oxidoreductase [Mycobacterium sp.]|nr:protein disulfide oxidoreductase [Mycobacterium sp.]
MEAIVTRNLIAVLAVTAALATACGSGTGSQPATPAAAPPVAAASSAPGAAPVPAQLQFTATTISGQQFSGESLVGKPAVIWFWAPWCPTCQREAPTVGKLAAANPDVTFLGVAGLDEVAAMKEFVEKYPVNDFTQLADTDGSIWTRFGVTQQPAYAFIDAEGGVDVARGSLSETELTERVSALSGR